jgi:hypothetical protein
MCLQLTVVSAPLSSQYSPPPRVHDPELGSQPANVRQGRGMPGLEFITSGSQLGRKKGHRGSQPGFNGSQFLFNLRLAPGQTRLSHLELPVSMHSPGPFQIAGSLMRDPGDGDVAGRFGGIPQPPPNSGPRYGPTAPQPGADLGQ